MKFLYILLVLAVVICYYGISMYQKLKFSQALMAKTIPFEKTSNDRGPSILVLGDSTAAGVGADDPNHSVAALFAKQTTASLVENYAVSGATANDLLTQLKNAQRTYYDYILIQVGGNDIIRFHAVAAVATSLKEALAELPASNRVIVMSAGNVGGATFFPWFMRPLYTARTLQFHNAFETVVSQEGGVYVNLYRPPAEDPFVEQPEVYLSRDGLHPSSEGYAYWFSVLREQSGI